MTAPARDFQSGGNGAALWRPGRLWSLWDMLKLKADEFHDNTPKLVSLSTWIAAQSSEEDKEGKAKLYHKDRDLDDSDRSYIQARFATLPQHLEALGARVTSMAVQDAREMIARPYKTWADAKYCLDEIHNTLRRELSLATVLVLEPKEQEYFAPKNSHFGNQFVSKFQTV